MNQTVFVNRMLNLKKIKYIGLDMDHTLIRYQTQHMESLVYDLVLQKLISNNKYPEEIGQFKFNFNDSIRGLIIDSKNGNILKLSRYGAIRQSYHGTRLIDYNEQQQFYRTTYVDLADPNYMAIDTGFSIAFCVLYAQLVDYRDKYPQSLPNYHEIAHDVTAAVDLVHSDGSLKSRISADLDHFVIKEKAVVDGLKRYAQQGKKIFILTNSDYHYSRLILDHVINPFLESGETWQDIFEFVITLANKPRFFFDNLPFLRINPVDGSMTNIHGPITKGVYQGGCARKFTKDLALNGDEILYLGDHIYGDIVRLKKDCNWRTALVVEELGAEIEAQKRALPLEQEIQAAMLTKQQLEQEYVQLYSAKAPDDHSNQPQIQALQQKIAVIDQQVSGLIKQQQQYYNPRWGRVFRAVSEESYFAYQVDRFACIYMEKLSDLLEHPPITYFRAHRRILAHDIDA